MGGSKEPREPGPDGQGRTFAHERIGYNYRLDELSAALGIASFKLDRILALRNEVASRYDALLEEVEGVRLRCADDDVPAFVVRLRRFRGPGDRPRDGHGAPRSRRDRVEAIPAGNPPPVRVPQSLRIRRRDVPVAEPRVPRGSRCLSIQGCRKAIRSGSWAR